MNTRTISVIIPVYNAEKYLQECLDSVREGSLVPDELILVDDGSTDSSPEILRKFTEDHPELTVLLITEENRGVSAARNRGLNAASCDYISFLDADDFFMKEHLQELSEKIGDADVCVSGKSQYSEKSGKIRRGRCPKYTGDLSTVRRHLFSSIRVMRGATGRLYRTALIRENGIRFREDLNYAEDMFFNFEFFYHIQKAVFTGTASYVYRTGNPDSLAHRESPFFLKQWKMQRSCTKKLRKEAKAGKKLEQEHKDK